MKYDAFISYSHSDCGTIAPAIQKAIENIGKPWYQLKRNLNIFRDETNLGANPHLWENIEKALDSSKNFILLASPKASESDWVTKEIEKWEEKDPSFQKFNIVVTSGEIYWDKNTNDFNWEKTTCLPKCLKDKFQSEPLYIDLKDYINKNNRPIDYKSSGFTYKIVKIIAAITGLLPREIESDEKKRRQRTILSLVSTFILLFTLVLLTYTFNKQKEINERNAIANNLIAEGNKFRDININKALLFYTYAYLKNSNKENFNILNNFYSNVVSYQNIESPDSLHFFVNKFFKKEIDAKLSSDLYNDDDINKIGVSSDGKKYFKITDASVRVYSLEKKNILYDVKFTNEKVLFSQINDDNENVLIETDSSNLYNYNVESKKLDTIAIDGMLLSKEQIFTTYGGYGSWYEVFAKNSKIIVFSSNDKISDHLFHIYIYDILKKQYKKYTIRNEISSSELNYKLLGLFSQNKEIKLYYKKSMDHGGSYNSEILLSLEPIVKQVFNEGPTYYSTKLNSTCVIFFNDLVIIGKKNGEIIAHRDFGYYDERYSEEVQYKTNGLRDIKVYKDFLIAGYENGDVNFYLLGGRKDNPNNSLQFDTFPLMKKISIIKGEGIERLSIIKNVLFVYTDLGKVFSIKLDKKIKLLNDRNKLLHQIKNELSIEDLSTQEKKEFKIDNI